MEEKHSHFGTPLGEWIARVPNELTYDGVGLWQIVPALRQDFGLEGDRLESAVRQTIAGLMDRGAVPVYCGSADGPSWVPSEVTEREPEEVVQFVLDKWVRGVAVEPTVGDLWFAVLED
jgi:hypothetical protein